MSAVYDGKDGRDWLDGIDPAQQRSNDDIGGPPVAQEQTTEDDARPAL
jgi:hypothetical protein